MGVLIVLLVQRQRQAPTPHLVLVGLCLFVIGGLLSTTRAQFPLSSITSLVKFFYVIGIWFWLGTILLQWPGDIQKAVMFWTLSAAIMSVGAAAQLIWGDIIPGTSPAGCRMTGFVEHVNELGGITSIALVPALHLAASDRQAIWPSCGKWLIVFLTAGGLILSGSVTGVLSAGIGFLIWAIMSKVALKDLAVFVIGAGTVIGLLSMANDCAYLIWLDRLNVLFAQGHDAITLASRFDTYKAAWEVISQEPIVGVGVGPLNGRTRTGYVVHNILLGSWYEAGLFGFLGMLLVLSSIAALGVKMIRNPSLKQIQMIGISFLSSYMAFVVFAFVQPIYFKRFVWISAALLVALYGVGRRSAWQTAGLSQKDTGLSSHPCH